MSEQIGYEKREEVFVQRAKELVGKMTLHEKVFQTLNAAGAIKRLGIPAYNWWNEALHGVARAGTATVFPQAIGIAATFDEDLVERIAEEISTQGRAKFNMQQKYGDADIYKGLTFWAPNVNIFRDPRWGRGHETFGEDPYLTSRLGVRFIRGIQGRDEKLMKAAACAKHFAVHSGPEDVRHSFNAEVSKQDLYETYLPAFKKCVQEGKVEAVMGAYNRTNGEPCCGSKTLLQDILRNEWGFKGHITSDCWAIKDFHENHHVTSGIVESVAMAMNAGCDLNCGNLFIYLEKAVKEGRVSEERIDEAVTRLFTTRMKLGMFDDTSGHPYSQIGYDVIDSEKSRELNFEAARKSLVLLKNKDNILPLHKDKLKTIGIIGPNANNRRALVGNYEGTASRYFTISEGIQDYVGKDVKVYYSEGCHLHKEHVSGLGVKNDRISEVKAVCEMSDVIIACMGLDSGLEGEEGDQGNEYASGDKPDLRLPGLQEDVLRVIIESRKPVVVLLLSGSALTVPYADEHADAILQCWYPGAEGGRAVAAILFGDYAPEGKLPITFYRTTEELPAFTDYNMQGRTYRYMKQQALYPFGYGLSYTDFKVSNISFSTTEIDNDISIFCDMLVENIGSMPGAETLQVYVKAPKEDAPNAQLKALVKVYLEMGESKRVRLTLLPEDFGLYDENGCLKLCRGEYKVYVGTSQPDSRSRCLLGREPECFILYSDREELL